MPAPPEIARTQDSRKELARRCLSFSGAVGSFIALLDHSLDRAVPLGRKGVRPFRNRGRARARVVSDRLSRME